MAEPRTTHGEPDSGFDYESIPPGYYDDVFRRGRGVQSKWHHLKFRRLREAISPGSRHLDFGCGPGTFLGTLDKSIDSLGVDISAQQVAYAQEHYGAPHRRFQADATGDFQLARDHFDCATVVEVIEHLPRPLTLSILEQIRTALRPGGRIVLTTPNYRSGWPILEYCVNRLAPVSYEDQHICKYTKSRLRKLLADGGYTSIQVTSYLFAGPFAAALGWGFADWIDRVEPRWIGACGGFLLLATAQKPESFPSKDD